MTPARTAPVDGGSVTAELAIALPAVVLMLALVLAVGSVVTAQVRCQDAARAAARAAARSDSAGAVRARAAALAPEGAVVSVGLTGDLVTVVVTAPVALPLPGRPQVTVRAQASADREQAGADLRTSAVPVRRVRREAGSGSVLVLAVALAAGVLAVAGAGLGQAVLSRHRAEAAADLAAIAAARSAATGSGDPCTAAARLAAANGARLASCSVRSGDGSWPMAEVAVQVPVPGPAGAWGPARGSARAAPAARPGEAAFPLVVTPCGGITCS